MCPSRTSVSSCARDVGLTSNETRSFTRRPRTIARRNSEVAIARIGRGTDVGLVDPLARDFAHRSHMPRAGWHGDQRLQARKIDLVMEVVVRARISDQFHPIVFSLPGTQEAANLVVGGEDSRRCAQFGTHVGDYVPIHRAQGVEARTIVLDDLAHAAFNAVAAQHLENHVLGAHPIRQPAGELHPPDLGHGRKEWLARHRQRHFQPAGADGQHAQRAARRCVAVRAEQRLARFAEVLLMTRVAHAISRSGKPDAEALARAAQEEMVVGILVIGLDDIVVDILDADLGLHPIQVHGFELQHHQCASGVLRQRLVDADPDFLTRLHVTVHQVRLDQLLRNIELIVELQSCRDLRHRSGSQVLFSLC